MRAFFLTSFFILFGCAALKPPPQQVAAPTVSYSRDIQPIFTLKCAECHRIIVPRVVAPGKAIQEQAKGGLVLTSYGSLMAGGASGQVVVPGKPGESLLVSMIRGTAKTKEGKERPRMPIGGTPLTEDQIQKIEKWIEEGAKNN